LKPTPRKPKRKNRAFKHSSKLKMIQVVFEKFSI
jgi:hypothetical protein